MVSRGSRPRGTIELSPVSNLPPDMRISTLLLVLAPTVTADEIRLTPVQDGTLYETTDGSLANGAGEYMFAGVNGMGDVRRCVMLFDVRSLVPKGATIDSVTLELSMDKTLAGPLDFSLHRLTSAWGEGASDAPLEEGAGTASERDDATWKHTFYPDQLWSTLGGDFDATASGTFSIGGTGSYSLSSAGMAADVQAWLDGASPNHGWILRQVDESASFTAKRFSTREATNEAVRPTLVVDFSVPEVGQSYCGPAVRNSTGLPGRIRALGSDVVADDCLTLRAEDLPSGQFGYFLNSQSKGFIQNPGGSQGNLCLSGSIGRYNKQVAKTGPAGVLQLLLDLQNTPTPSGPVAIQPGETWHFQAWYRDKNPSATSNFTDGTTVTFQ